MTDRDRAGRYVGAMRYSPWFVSGQWVEAPVWPPIVGGVLAFLGLVALAGAWWSLFGLGARRALAPLLGGLCGALLGGAFAGSPVAFVIGEPIRAGDAMPSWWAHALPWELAVGTAVIGGATAGAAVAALIAGQTAARAFAIPAGILGAAAGIAPIAWVAWLVAQGPVPLIVADPGHAHPGHTVTPGGSLRGDPDHLWMLTLPGAVVAGPPGPLDAPLVAERGPVRTGKACGVEVGRDDGDPRMPFELGNRWTFDSTVTSQITVVPLALAIVDLGDRREGSTVVVTVTGVDDTGPVRLREVTVDGQIAKVYGWNGATYTADGSPLFEDTKDGVSNGLLPGWRCDYGPASGGALALPGPTACHKAPGGLANVAVSAFIGIATAGLLIPDPSPTGSLVAITSRAAP